MTTIMTIVNNDQADLRQFTEINFEPSREGIVVAIVCHDTVDAVRRIKTRKRRVHGCRVRGNEVTGKIISNHFG